MNWAHRASENEILKNASYPFPKPSLTFAGVVIQRFRLYRAPSDEELYGIPSRPFQVWIQKMEQEIAEGFIPSMKRMGILAEESDYVQAGIPDSKVLAKIQEFNSLLPRSQECRVPVYELTDDQLDQVGVVLAGSKRQIKSLYRIFEEFANRVISLSE